MLDLSSVLKVLSGLGIIVGSGKCECFMVRGIRVCGRAFGFYEVRGVVLVIFRKPPSLSHLRVYNGPVIDSMKSTLLHPRIFRGG